MANGWYRRRPDHTRGDGRRASPVLLILAGIGLTVLLAATTSFGLLGLPLVVFGLLMVFGVRIFPSRTAKGYGTLRRILGFKRFIDESEKERAQFAERQNLFSEYLPYAVVFGATEKWARAFAGLDGQLPRTDWYVSDHLFTAVLFSQAMGGFTTTDVRHDLVGAGVERRQRVQRRVERRRLRRGRRRLVVIDRRSSPG